MKIKKPFEFAEVIDRNEEEVVNRKSNDIKSNEENDEK